MNLFQTFFPLVLLLLTAIVVGWVIPWGERRATAGFDLDAAIARNREALDRAFMELQEAAQKEREIREQIEAEAKAREWAARASVEASRHAKAG